MKAILIRTCLVMLCLTLLNGCSNSSIAQQHKADSTQAENNEVEISQYKYYLIVDRQLILSPYTYVDYDEKYQCTYGRIPLIATLKALGAKITWESKTSVKIEIQNETYYLNPIESCLTKGSSQGNYLLPPPGSTTKAGAPQYIEHEKEFVIGTPEVDYLLSSLNAHISLRRYSNVILIEYQEGS